MKLSVLIPVYNSGRYLGDALESISRQTCREFEIVAIDDGSTDDSAERLKAHAARDPRLRWTSRANRGVIATRNELVDRASGEWIAWMDSDDVSEVDRLARQLERLDADDRLLCVGTEAQCVDPSGARLNLESYPTGHDDIVAAQRSGGGMRFPTTMMKRAAVMAVGGFREPFAMGEDLDLLLRLGERGRLANIPVPLYRYRQHVDSICAGLGSQWFAYRDPILELARQRRENGHDLLQAGGSIVIPPVDKRRMNSAVAATYVSWASHALGHGDRMRAVRYALTALAEDPLAFRIWAAFLKTASGAARQLVVPS